MRLRQIVLGGYILIIVLLLHTIIGCKGWIQLLRVIIDIRCQRLPWPIMVKVIYESHRGLYHCHWSLLLLHLMQRMPRKIQMRVMMDFGIDRLR